MQVHVSKGSDNELLMLVAAQVEMQPNAESLDTDPTEDANPSHVRVFADSVTPDQWFCVHNHGAYSLRAPWLQTLAANLSHCEPLRTNFEIFLIPITSILEIAFRSCLYPIGYSCCKFTSILNSPLRKISQNYFFLSVSKRNYEMDKGYSFKSVYVYA